MTKLKKLIDGKGFNKLIEGRHGYTLYNVNDAFVGRSIDEYGEYNKNESDFFASVVKDGDVVVEVGANIGSHTMQLSDLVGTSGRVFAFEPQRIIFQNLCANIALNSLTNVYSFQYAVGEQPGNASIPNPDYSSKGNFGAIKASGTEPGESVPLISLDTFCALPRLNMLKIDVEGMETKVIKGAQNTIKRLKPILYVENDQKDKSEELIKLIMSLDYKLFWHFPSLFSPDNFANNPTDVFNDIVSLNMICLPQGSNIDLVGAIEVKNPTDFPQTR